MTEWLVSYECGAWTLNRMEPDGKVWSTAPMPTLEDALREACNQSGGPVGIKLVARS
jgi:hypothetical protein